jgi:hypothetical protein
MISSSVEGFLNQLGGPAMITVEGHDRSRTRAICTLLHGNEPSGLKAVHRWLSSGGTPAVNIVCFIISVKAALTEELYKHRILPGQRDMNRCFFPPFNDVPGLLAEEILEQFAEHQPECILDIHNTSGHSPDFGVVTYEDAAHEALVSLFCDRLVVTDLRLGSMMETSTRRCPVVTIECGGVVDDSSDEVAWHGLQRYLHEQDVMRLEHGHHMDIYHHPVRLELQENTVIAYASSYILGTDLTVPPDLDRCNFGTVEPGTLVAWLGEKRGLQSLRVNDALGNNVFQRYFTVKGNQLVTAQRVKLFMITGRPDIALSDCLLYVSLESEHDVLDT